jgi:hypothetical protein
VNVINPSYLQALASGSLRLMLRLGHICYCFFFALSAWSLVESLLPLKLNLAPEESFPVRVSLPIHKSALTDVQIISNVPDFFIRGQLTNGTSDRWMSISVEAVLSIDGKPFLRCSSSRISKRGLESGMSEYFLIQCPVSNADSLKDRLSYSLSASRHAHTKKDWENSEYADRFRRIGGR